MKDYTAVSTPIASHSTNIANVSVLPTTPRRILTANEKFKRESGITQKIASVISEMGMTDFETKLKTLTQLLDFWQNGKNCTVIEVITQDTHTNVDTEHDTVLNTRMHGATLPTAQKKRGRPKAEATKNWGSPLSFKRISGPDRGTC